MEEVRAGEQSERTQWRRRDVRVEAVDVLRRLVELQVPDDFDNWDEQSVVSQRLTCAEMSAYLRLIKTWPGNINGRHESRRAKQTTRLEKRVREREKREMNATYATYVVRGIYRR